ncbi:MAG: hypothetical protein M3R17_13720 [Bacteroidota bacterium]|nr:hypothetical protein [Bacteroidota bacterium]
MKKYLLPVIAICLFACDKGPTKESLEIEKSTLACWNENWVDTKGYDISKGITQLDDYLFSKGLLGKRTVEDYKNFFNDTAIVFIPDSVKGSMDMRIALNTEFDGAPNIEGMIKCWETNWFNKLNTLDTADVLHGTGVLVEKLSGGGDIEFRLILDDFFKGMTEEEMKRPLVKDIAYFIFWKTRARETHIKFVHPDVMSNGDSLPPPSVPVK